MFYQSNPIIAFGVIAVIIGAIFIAKRGKNGGSFSSGMFHSSRHPQQDNYSTLMMANMALLQTPQPLLSAPPLQKKEVKKEIYSEQAQRILNLLDVKNTDK